MVAAANTILASATAKAEVIKAPNSAVNYVGADPTPYTRSISTVYSVQKSLEDSPYFNRTAMIGLIIDACEARATTESVERADNGFAVPDDYKQRDTDRNVLRTFVNTYDSPVALESNGKLASSWFPLMGAGWLAGPWGLNNVKKLVGVGGVREAIGTFTSGVISPDTLYRPMCFGTILLKSSNTAGRPVVEIRTGTTTDGALLALGRGRTMFSGLQSVPLMPVAENGTAAWLTGEDKVFTATMWLYDAAGNAGVSMESAADVAGALFLFQAPPKA